GGWPAGGVPPRETGEWGGLGWRQRGGGGGPAGVPPAMSLTMAAAHSLACELAAAAERGIAPAMAASPITWMFGCSFDSNVTGSTGHQPVRSATPAIWASCPAFCGGAEVGAPALDLVE